MPRVLFKTRYSYDVPGRVNRDQTIVYQAGREYMVTTAAAEAAIAAGAAVSAEESTAKGKPKGKAEKPDDAGR